MTYRLTGASVDLRGGVVLRYTVTGEQPKTGFLTFSTTFCSADGDHVEQLGFKLVGGHVVAVFSIGGAAMSNPMLRNYPTSFSRTGETWTIVLPSDALQSARGGGWRADLDVNGQEGGTIEGTPLTTIPDDDS